jgi:hypothetical protein
VVDLRASIMRMRVLCNVAVGRYVIICKCEEIVRSMNLLVGLIW